MKATKTKRRNQLAFHPLMKKGGEHKKSGKAERHALKLATRQLVVEARERD